MTTLPSDPDMADRVLMDVGREAFKHARDLLRAARLILDAGIWSVAYANAALALEEIGKGVICTGILPMPDEERKAEVESFQRRFTDHEAKSYFAHLVLQMTEGDGLRTMEQAHKGAVRDARRTNKNKFRGLYVDYKETGHILKPSDITSAQATELISTAEKALALSKDAEEALAQPALYLALLRRVRAAGSHGVWGDVAGGIDALLLAMSAVARDEVTLQEAFQGTPLGAMIESLVLDDLVEEFGTVQGEGS
ncbi:AbiV family abortive infection protein [Streptomyces sp. NPDC006482]|uniref:AbiV family abortive infection protein n=1 Tax=Streptomyces sp. NPDC006482 TaxID=3154306 RepID=UPI0033B8A496